MFSQAIFILTSTLLAFAGFYHDVRAEVPCQGRWVVPERNAILMLDRSDTYCLSGDLRIDNANPLYWHGTGRPVLAVEITHDDITLDLQGHTIYAGNTTIGVFIHGTGAGLGRTSPLLTQPRRIVIRNGAIKVATWHAIQSGIAPMVVPSDMGDPLEGVSLRGKSPEEIEKSSKFWKKIHLSMLDDRAKLRPATPSNYAPRDIQLENLRIFAHGGIDPTGARDGAINLQGANTIIRDCIIETEAGTAIWIFGPNALIENNTIIVHGTNRQREADAPIRLIQADGAIIRNNKIVLRDEANRRAISTFDTGPITVENNTFYGLDKPDQVAQAFLGTLNMRESGSRFEPGWKGWFPGVR